MLQVSEILRVKGNTLFTASPETQVVQALETMSTHDIGSLVRGFTGNTIRSRDVFCGSSLAAYATSNSSVDTMANTTSNSISVKPLD